MHLPPLEVAVYPIATTSYTPHNSRPESSSSTLSAPSVVSSSSLSSTAPTSPGFSSIQKVIRTIFRSSRISVQQVERLEGRLHQVYLARLAEGSPLVLKCPPTHTTRLLRHEQHGLQTESQVLELLRNHTQLSVPQVIKYDPRGGALGAPFLMTSHVAGRRLSEMASYLSNSERKTIDRALGAHVRSISSLSATQFGLTHRVFAKKGHSSWQEAFLALLESALRDAEDMLVTIAYDSVRYYIGKHSRSLEEVTEPRLVCLDVCDPKKVLIDERTRQVTGLVGFSNIVWGDPLMAGGFENASDAFLEGYGVNPMRTVGGKARLHIYTAYRAVVDIVARYYRPHMAIDEIEARRSLTRALNELAQMPA
ncbi:hypothetical protein GQ43DRAFT_53500 [Delitschia confertaspora ATCC 74209]|uniref:Aminoglycoside phosphotransferase domain-containing protein n=1 Tax=Delitschia confertaspora ATCC 74209 TaxID=1513339 RepID=A0A9P4MYJ4_9PLEO|nr:hypothetical protein GQ43DRAFT_53500 [Delitschia confertaspora ATCC 74209]